MSLERARSLLYTLDTLILTSSSLLSYTPSSPSSDPFDSKSFAKSSTPHIALILDHIASVDGGSCGVKGKAIRTKCLFSMLKRVAEICDEVGSGMFTFATETDNSGATTSKRKRLQIQEIHGSHTAALLNNSSSLLSMVKADPANAGSSDLIFEVFYAELKRIKTHHAVHGGSVRINSLVDAIEESRGYRSEGGMVAEEVLSLITEALSGTSGDDFYFSDEEVYGKYLDLEEFYATFVLRNDIFSHDEEEKGKDKDKDKEMDKDKITSISIAEFIDLLLVASLSSDDEKIEAPSCLTALPQTSKLRDRKKYGKLLIELNGYLRAFALRVSPFEVAFVLNDEAFEKGWKKGRIKGWEGSGEDENNSSSSSSSSNEVDLSNYANGTELLSKLSVAEIRKELTRLGMKSGGLETECAKRLFSIKGKKEEEIPAKLFAKGHFVGSWSNTSNSSSSSNSVESEKEKPLQSKVVDFKSLSRKDLARLESSIGSICIHLRPTLQATSKRLERRQVQTVTERRKEAEEEIWGLLDKRLPGYNPLNKDNANSDDEGDEGDEEEIYNPKNLPLGWDGKPIPVWLYKLHGLNKFFKCEVCGNESYRGSRNYEAHFSGPRHTLGMKGLGVPNSFHFHGVTKIEDVKVLWEKVRLNENVEAGTGNKVVSKDAGEEYEDLEGNVLSKRDYEDLARQGML